METTNQFYQSMEYIKRYSRQLYQEINEMIDIYVDMSEEEKDKLSSNMKNAVTMLETISSNLSEIDNI